jgi:hypothetical protein
MLGPCLGVDTPHQDHRIAMGGWAGKMRDKNRDASMSKSKAKSPRTLHCAAALPFQRALFFLATLGTRRRLFLPVGIWLNKGPSQLPPRSALLASASTCALVDHAIFITCLLVTIGAGSQEFPNKASRTR